MELTAEEESLLSGVREIYYLRANQCEKNWARDNAAALKIQSKFKMYIKRKEFLRKKAAAITIQTHFRSYYARKSFKLKRRQDTNNKCLTYFDHQATLIQKVFRGYFVRKLIHNFYMRKQELKALEEKNNHFKEELEEYGKVQAQEAEQYQQELARS